MSKPYMIWFHLLPLYTLPAAMTLFLLIKYQTDAYPRTLTLAVLPARTAPLHSDSRRTFPNLQAAVRLPSTISTSLIFWGVFISALLHQVFLFMHLFICWPAKSGGTEALVGQGFVCVARPFSLPYLEHSLTHNRSPKHTCWMNEWSQSTFLKTRWEVHNSLHFTNKKTRHREVEQFAHSQKARNSRTEIQAQVWLLSPQAPPVHSRPAKHTSSLTLPVLHITHLVHEMEINLPLL